MLALSPNLHPQSDEELMSLLASGNRDGFDIIFNKYHKRVHSIAMRYLKSETVADEVVQEVFMKLWLERKNINNAASIVGWLCIVAKNNTLNRLKKQAAEWRAINQLKVIQPQSDDSTQEKLKEADCNNLLATALKTLSENQQKVFKLAREENQSYLQIADHMNISPLTVKTHMSRALSNLKYFFASYLS